VKRDEVKTHPPRYATLRFVINVSSCEDFTLSMTKLGKVMKKKKYDKVAFSYIFSLFVFFFFFFLTFLFTFLFLFTLSYSILVSRLGGYRRIVKNNSLLRCVCAHADGLACRRACIDQSTVLQVALVSTRFCLSCGSLNATGNDRLGYGWLKGGRKGVWLVG